MNENSAIYNSRIIKTYLEYLEKYYPDIDIDSIFEYAGMTRHEVEDPGHWFNQRQIDQFYQMLVEKTGNPKISRLAGRYAASSEGMGPLKQYTLGLMSPTAVYLLMERIYAIMSRGATVKAKKTGPHKVEIISTPKPRVNEKPHQCENRIGTFEAVAKLFTGRFARIEHPSCFHKGAKSCRYVITWERTPSLLWKQIRNYLFLLGISLSLILYFALPILPWIVLVALFALSTFAISLFSLHLEKRKLINTIETQGDVAKDHLEEINIRYNNALLIQEIGQATSMLLNIQALTKTVTDAMEKRLDFDRGGIWLANNEATRLVYQAGYGYNPEIEKFLQTASFHLDKPRSRGVAVKAFRQQKPYLVNDTAQIEKDLSKRSREFIKQIGTHSFICVPIVYEGKSLGVLFVDNLQSKRPFTQTDINLLMGIASQTAISLINALSFEKLHESEEKYRTILDNIEDAYFEVDSKGNFTFFNDSLCRMIGYSRPELIGMNNRQYMDKENAKKVFSVFNQVYTTGEPTKAFDWEIIKKDGSKRHIDASISLIRDLKAHGIGFRGIARDISERKRSEEALRKSEAKYRELVQNANSIIMRRDPQGTITFFNEFAQNFFGYTEDEILGKNVVGTIVPEKDSAGGDLAAMIREIGLHPERYAVNENENMKRNGELVWVAWTNRAIRNKDGDIVEILCIGNDITEQKRLESQLQYAQRMEALGTLAGGIAHNFNNILMGINGNTTLMLLETDPAQPNYKRIQDIEKLVDSGSKLTRQLLGYARGGKYEVRSINLNKVIRDTADTFATTKKDITIHQELAQDLCGIRADRGQIEQIFLNLYVNAADAMPRGGDLFIKTITITDTDMGEKPYKVRPGTYAMVTVRDTGLGMDKKTRERIFDPFFTTKGLGKGTGLGLASVYGIIKAHGGYIDVNSAKGRGTTFTVYLPASGKDIEEAVESPEHIAKGTETILLVDDEVMLVEVGSEVLRELGYRVLAAQNGREAIEVYRENRDTIDLVILDMIMPDMGGGETYDRIKEINPEVKALLSSGYSIDGQATEILNRGCNGFIQKPFSIRELSVRIREILDKS